MAKTTREEVTTEAPVAAGPAKSVEAAAKRPISVEEPVKALAPMLVTFDRWFAARQFKPHWKKGMQAFVDTSGRKTVEEWNETFKKY